MTTFAKMITTITTTITTITTTITTTAERGGAWLLRSAALSFAGLGWILSSLAAGCADSGEEPADPSAGTTARLLAAHSRALGRTEADYRDDMATGSEEQRVRALQMITARGGAPVQAETLAAVSRALEDESEQVRALAVSTLGRFGPRAEGAVPQLVQALDDAKLRDVTIDALGRIGAPARAAVPRLLELLGDRTQRGATRRLAIASLARVDPQHPELVRALQRASDDPDRRVRHAARTALAAAEN